MDTVRQVWEALVVVGHVATLLFGGASVVLFAVLIFCVIPGVVKDQRADRQSARSGSKRAETAPLEKVAS
jgi:hypothetical protein